MSRRTNKLVVSVVVSAMLLLPIYTVSAQDLTQRQQAVCEQLEVRAERIVAGFDDRDYKLSEAKANLSYKLQEQRRTTDARLAERRAKSDAHRQEVHDTMIRNAANDDEQTKVSTYSQAVEAALKEIRQAYDEAREVYRQKADELLMLRQQATEQAAAQYREAVMSTIVTTRNNCKWRSADLAQIREVFVNGLQRARLDYAEARRTIQPGLNEAINQLKNERNESMSQARARFERAMQSASSYLNTVAGEPQ